MDTPVVIEVNGRRTRVRVDGSQRKPPILLLHGIGRSLEDWEPQYRRLAEYRTIALDIPGFGFSNRPRQPMSLRVLAQGIAETLDALEERRPLHVVGNSLGGALALQLLGHQPRRVASLVLVNSAGFGSEVNRLARVLTIPGIGGFAARHPTRASARMMERLIFDDPSLATDERVDHALTISRQPEVGAALHEMARVLGTVKGFRSRWRAELIARATKHPRPTLIMWGDRDRFLPARQLIAARRLLPHAETHLLTGVGHMPQIECPGKFAELVLGFIRRISAP